MRGRVKKTSKGFGGLASKRPLSTAKLPPPPPPTPSQVINDQTFSEVVLMTWNIIHFCVVQNIASRLIFIFCIIFVTKDV